MGKQNINEKNENIKQLEEENKQLKQENEELKELNKKLKMLEIGKNNEKNVEIKNKKGPKKPREAKMFFIMDLYEKEEKPKPNFMKYFHSEENNKKWNDIKNEQKKEYIEKERIDKERYEEEIN